MNIEKELIENIILETNNKDEYLNKIKEIINGLPVSEKDKLIDSYIDQINEVEGYHYDIARPSWTYIRLDTIMLYPKMYPKTMGK